MSEVGCYDAGSDKSSNKDYNNHSDYDSNSNSKGNIRADPTRNNILRRKRKECMLPGYLVCEHCEEEADVTKDEDGVRTDTRVKSHDSMPIIVPVR